MNSEVKKYFTYIVECSDWSLYTGYTVDIAKRVATHNSGKGAKYVRGRTPVKLVYFEEFDTVHKAMSREFAIKQLPRYAKLKLIHTKEVTNSLLVVVI